MKNNTLSNHLSTIPDREDVEVFLGWEEKGDPKTEVRIKIYSIT